MIFVSSALSGCQPWSTDRSAGFDEEIARFDRNVYCELSVDEIISIVDEVMSVRDPGWPGEETPDCLEQLYQYEVRYWDDISEPCGTISDYACAAPFDFLIDVSKAQPLLNIYENTAHEFIHHVGLCFYGDVDGYHKRKDLWRGNDPENSVEAQANTLIWQSTRKDACEEAIGFSRQ